MSLTTKVQSSAKQIKMVWTGRRVIPVIKKLKPNLSSGPDNLPPLPFKKTGALPIATTGINFKPADICWLRARGLAQGNHSPSIQKGSYW